MTYEQAGLYIHIPFCLSKCGYCNFYSIESANLIPEYIAALQKEIKHYRNAFSSFDTVYIGGGTPSLLTPTQLGKIFSVIHKCFNIEKNVEITLEANPGDVSPTYLKEIRQAGVNRLNIGIQSFNDKALHYLGRRHTGEEAAASIKAARKAGFNNLGIDLIYGISGFGIKSWTNDLQNALSFAPEHISCYELSLNKQTALYKQHTSSNRCRLTEDKKLKLFFSSSDTLEQAGYTHYEVSNFARRDTFKSRHNQKYWRHSPYLGLGPAAHSFLGNVRWWNSASIKTYIKDLSSGKTPVQDSEVLSTEQLKLEALFLGLRTKDGIDLKAYQTRYGIDILADKINIIKVLIQNNLIECKDGFLLPTRRGMAVADSLALT